MTPEQIAQEIYDKTDMDQYYRRLVAEIIERELLEQYKSTLTGIRIEKGLIVFPKFKETRGE